MGWVNNASLLPLYPRKRPSTHCTAGWMGPRAGLDGCGKRRPKPGFGPRTVQPVASRCTNYAILVHFLKHYFSKVYICVAQVGLL